MAERIRARRGHLSRRADEGGFTLVELLLVIVILGVVIASLGAALIAAGHSTAETTKRFNESHDAQIASAYLATDVQSGLALTTNTCYPSGLNLINFSYDGGASVASYYYGTVDGESRLTRRFCDPSGALVSDATLVHFAGPTPTVVCSGGCDPATNPRPNSVRISITESDGYAYSLSGSRRIFAAGANPGVAGAFPPLLTLGTAGVQLRFAGNGSIVVNGGIIVNSDATPAVTRNGSNSNLGYSSLQIVSPGTCSGCPSPAPIGRAEPVPDPLLYLPIPDEAGQPVYTDGNPTHGPGVYRGMPLSFPNGNIPLAPGVYIVESGFSFAATPNITGTGILLFNGCGRNAPVSCLNTGAFNVAGQIDLDLEAATTGDYKDLVFWQPYANTSAVSITGQGSVSFQRVMYAPAASSITLGAGLGDFLAIGSVIGSNISVSGNGTVNIG